MKTNHVEKSYMQINNKPFIAFVAGHSGGHIIPCLTIAEKLYHTKNIYSLFFTTQSQLDKKIISSKKYIARTIYLPLTPIPQKKRLFISFASNFIRSFILSIWYLHNSKPEKIISTGGIIALPVCLAAKLLNLPIELYELNADPGKAIQFLAPFSKTIFTCFKITQKKLPKDKCTYASYPLRNQNMILHKNEKEFLNFSPERKTIFILGGSQGSQFINKTVFSWLTRSETLHPKIQIIHQTGKKDYLLYKRQYAPFSFPYILFDYSQNLTPYYQKSDIIICRSGAGTLFEIINFNKHCITIPLETNSTNHQINNARTLAHEYPFIKIMLQKEIESNPDYFSQKITYFLR